MWRESFLELLREEFTRLKVRNPKFSLRAFARRLGLGPGPLSDMLRSQMSWNLSRERAVELLGRMEVPREKLNRQLVLMGLEAKVERVSLPEDKFFLIADPLYAAVLAAYRLAPEAAREALLREGMGISGAELEAAREELKAVGALQAGPDGSLEAIAGPLRPAADTAPERWRETALRLMRTQLAAAEEARPGELDTHAITFVADEQALSSVRREIERLVANTPYHGTGGGEGCRLYTLAVQLFPAGKRPS